MDLSQYYGKNVILTYRDGEIIRGFVDVFTPYYDDDDAKENSITVGDRWVYESEIKKIEIIDDVN